MKILLDENLSPTLVHKLGAIGVAAEHVVHLGKSGLSDPALWDLALERDAIVATINASDFLRLAGTSALHAGLISCARGGSTAMRSGLGWSMPFKVFSRRGMTWSTRSSR